MKYISDRISYQFHKEYTTVVISSKIEKWQEGLILGWLIAWTLIGFSFIYMLFGFDFERDQKLYLWLFLVFWLFFEYRIARVFIWRRFGMEYIKLDSEKFTYKRAFGRYGKANEYLLGNIKNIHVIERKSHSFAKAMESSFWDIGNEAIAFFNLEKIHLLGVQLDEKESKDLVSFLNREHMKYLKQKS